MDAPFDIYSVQTPAYVVCRELLERNLRILREVKQRTGCNILLAQKAFSTFAFYPLIADYLDGTTASGLYEARLGRECFKGEVHVFSPAYTSKDFDTVADLADHIVFNSLAQYEKFSAAAQIRGKSCGLRINPEKSTQRGAIYDPCAYGSRLGITRNELTALPSGVEGLHFHTLCEQNADALEVTLAAVEEKFGEFLPEVKWINLGGGHHITRDGYDIDRLTRLIVGLKNRYGVEVYIEPGEAVALNAGFLVGEVIDLVKNGDVVNAVLDTSAACHMPDVLEMPYRPPVLGGGAPGEKPYLYRLTGGTCLAGDIIGDYSFDEPLSIGSRVTLGDMAIYTMVKNNTFNGLPLPSIYKSESGKVSLIRAFSYGDFKSRLS